VPELVADPLAVRAPEGAVGLLELVENLRQQLRGAEPADELQRLGGGDLAVQVAPGTQREAAALRFVHDDGGRSRVDRRDAAR
jgi:hypothetical protein